MKPTVVTAIPGPRSRELRAREDAHLAPGAQRYAMLAGIAVDHARGCAVTDVDGNTFIDLIGGIGVGAVGHSHPRVAGAIAEQASRALIGSFTSAARVELVERMASHAPAPGVHRLQLYSSGAETVESALRLARAKTGRDLVVGFSGRFHGKTMGALLPGAPVIPYADCYRCPVAATYPSCGIACAEAGRAQLAPYQGRIAAVIVEPMQGTAGNVVPPPEFLPAVAAIAKEHDALLIADEMITGLGRTGHYWGVDGSGVAPDIVTIGKAFGGGYPLSGLMTTDAVADAPPWSNPSGSSSSYGGNPLAAAAGAAATAVIDDEKLVDNARRVGEIMLGALAGFVDRYPFVGHVRGAGLMLGIELVADKASRAPLPPAACEDIFHRCLQRGLLTMAYTASLRIQPPLTIDEPTALEAVAVLAAVFDQIS